jgi:hypothetical protein
MWIDVKPKGGIQVLTAFAFNIEGLPIHSPDNITPDKAVLKEVVSDGQTYQVTLNFHQERLDVG